MGVFIISPLPPVLAEEIRTAGPLRSAGVTPPRRYYEPIRHPLVVGRLPGVAGYTAYPASALSGRDEEGFSSCSMCPGPRAVANHPAGATHRINRVAVSHAAFALAVAGSASGAIPFRSHLTFTFVTARELALIPGMRMSRGFRPLVSLRPALPATGLPILTPAGLPPAEHISLSWTHNRTCDFHRIRLSLCRSHAVFCAWQSMHNVQRFSGRFASTGRL